MATVSRQSEEKWQLPLRVLVTARALFNLSTEHKIYQRFGAESYYKWMQSEADVMPPPGPAFDFITQLLRLRKVIQKYDVFKVRLYFLEFTNRYDEQ